MTNIKKRNTNPLSSGVVENNTLNTIMTGNYIIDESFVCTAFFLINYYCVYKQDALFRQECQLPVFEALRNICECFDAHIKVRLALNADDGSLVQE